LSDLKKNGLLGRDTVLRKTMLDECKGERFDEVLFVFSSLVIRKYLQHKDKGAGAARQLGVAGSLTTQEQSLLEPLLLVHKSTLWQTLQERRDLEGRLRDFEQLLELKRRQFLRKHEELRITNAGSATDGAGAKKDLEVLKKPWKENWLGDQKWLNTILDSDNSTKQDPVLGMPFEFVFRRVEKGTLWQIEEKRDVPLIEELDSRVRLQKERMDRWTNFKQEIGHKKHTGTRENASQGAGIAGMDITFTAHRNLKFNTRSGSPTKRARPEIADEEAISTDSGEGAEYTRLISSMTEELSKTGKSRRRGGRGWRKTKKEEAVELYASEEEEEEAEDFSIEDPGAKVNAMASHSPPDSTIKADPESDSAESEEDRDISHSLESGEPEEEPVEEVLQRDFPTPVQAASSQESSDDEDALPPHIAAALSFEALSPPSSPPLPPQSYSPAETEPIHSFKTKSKLRLSDMGMEDQELLAEDIVASITNAPPSPEKQQQSQVNQEQKQEKPRLSLAERTRQSISLSSISLDKKAFPNRTAEIDTLNKKARKSMANSRKSYIPSVPDYPLTPIKDSPRAETDTDTTPREDLFTTSDYASVFKSRPKIALSPTFSPSETGTVGRARDDVEGDNSLAGMMGELEGDEEDEEDDVGTWRAESSSPLVRAKGRGGVMR
jgi:HAUS augmin-like complex subunit 6 N-terminus